MSPSPKQAHSLMITNGLSGTIDRSARRLAQDNWPKRADGSNKSVGEMTAVEHQNVAAAAIRSLQPEMARIGIALEFGGHINVGGRHE